MKFGFFENFGSDNRKRGDEKPINPPPFREGASDTEKGLVERIQRLEKRIQELEEENEKLRMGAKESSPDGFKEECYINEDVSLGSIVVDGAKKPAVKEKGNVRQVPLNAEFNIGGGGIEAYFWDTRKEEWVLND